MTEKDVIAYKDEDFMILHAKDRFNGIRVQLYAFIEKHKQESDGSIKSLGRVPTCIEEIAVPCFVYGRGARPAPTNVPAKDAKHQLVDPSSFRNNVLAADTQMRTIMETVYKRTDQMADGVLNDLRNKYKDLNAGDRALKI